MGWRLGGDRTPGPTGVGTQLITNSCWPRYPTNFREREPIPVWVRIVWARDGEEWCAGEADRWNPWFVRVRFDYTEPRAVQRLTWVQPRDVHRRAVPPAADSAH
jgi:hypothetical protein